MTFNIKMSSGLRVVLFSWVGCNLPSPFSWGFRPSWGLGSLVVGSHSGVSRLLEPGPEGERSGEEVNQRLPLGYEIHYRPLAATRIRRARFPICVDIHHVRKLSALIVTVDGHVPMTFFSARRKHDFVGFVS
jgi:hypothetical protein